MAELRTSGVCGLSVIAGVIAGVSLVAVLALPDGARAQSYGDEIWEFASALALIDAYGPETRPPLTLADMAEPFGRTPGSIMAAIEERIVLIPYAGRQRTPVQVIQGGAANTLDRAVLAAGLMQLAGVQARIVRAANSGNMAEYGAASPGPGMPFAEEDNAVIKQDIAARAPAELARMRAAMPGLADGMAFLSTPPEQEVYWIRAVVDGSERDLVFSDLAVEDPAMGEVCDEPWLAGQEWRTGLSLHLVYGTETVEVLEYEALAKDLHLTPVTVSIQPEGNFESYVPLLLVGEESHTGQSFHPVLNGQPLERAFLRLRLAGPGEERVFDRPLVEKAGVANEFERGFEIVSSARLTVVAGPVSDETFAAEGARQLARLAELLFEPDALDGMRPVNEPSLKAIGLLDSMHLGAGHLGPGSGSVLAFQARPSMVLQRMFVATEESGMRLMDSMDVLEPGHGLYGSDGESLALAMVEQGLYDAMLEDWLNLGDEADTTHSLLASLAGQPFKAGFPAGRNWDDRFANGRPEYLLLTGANGPAPGWRIDPGPQAVPLLDNGTGGSLSIKEHRERMAEVCKVMQWGTMFIPSRVVPSGMLLGGLVEYHCKLAEAYNRSADALSMVADMIAGEEPDMGRTLEDLENQIQGLGRDLAAAMARSIASEVVGSAVVKPVVGRFVSDVAAPAMRWIGRRANRQLARHIGHGATEAAETGSANAIRRGFNGEMARLSRLMRDAGWTREQRRNFFRHFGCFLEGTMVRTPDGAAPIESLRQGDMVLARDPVGESAKPREVLAVEERYVAECLRLTMANGEVLETSAGHPMYMPEVGAWLNAGELRPGDMLLTEFHGNMELAAMEYHPCPAPSYDLSVSGEHTFLVADAGVLAHNNDWCDRNRQMLEEGLANNRTMQEILTTLEYPPYMRDAASWIPQRNATLGDLVEAHYASRSIGRRSIPPMHTTDMAGWRGIRNSGVLRPPDSGAAWSYNGTLRDGNVAIRVREGSEQFVEMVPNSRAFGQNARYWPDGIGNGTWRPEVPSEHLEYYNYHMDRWDRFLQLPGG